MKFLKLEILNLASLDREEGEVIDFEHGAIAESNIFSIVGPTGSGKSTILDAICLALFGRAPRYPRKRNERNLFFSVYGQKDEDENNRLAPTDCRNILTRGKKYGYSKLTFLANNGCVYRAEWSVTFKRRCFDNAITSLYIISAEDGRPVEREARWDELPAIIGLDYDQFLRTVLIAQGSFAGFLSAKEDERYTLLERIVGNEETYSRIARAISEHRQDARNQLDIIKAQVAAYAQIVMSEEQAQALAAEIARLEDEKKAVADQLETVNKALALHGDIEARKKHISQLELECKNTGDKISALSHQISEAQSLLATLQQAATAAITAYDNSRPAITRARELKAYVANAATLVAERRKASTRATSDLVKAIKALPNGTISVDSLDDALHAMAEAEKVYLTHYQRLSSCNLLSLQERKTLADKAVADLATLAKALQSIDEKKQNLATVDAQWQKLTDQNKEIADKLKKINIEQLSDELTTLRRTHILLTGSDLARRRSELKTGEPCPLCGSPSHPYADSQALNEVVDEIDQLIADKQAILDDQTRSKDQLNTRLAGNGGRLRQIDISSSGIRSDISIIEREIAEIYSAHPHWTHKREEFSQLQQELDLEQQLAAKAIIGYNELAAQTEASRHVFEKTKSELEVCRRQADKRLAEDALNESIAMLSACQQAFDKECGGKDPDELDRDMTKAKDKAIEDQHKQESEIARQSAMLEGLKGRHGATRQNIDSAIETNAASEQVLMQWLRTIINCDDRNFSSEDIDNMLNALRTELTAWKSDALDSALLRMKAYRDARAKLGELYGRQQSARHNFDQWDEIVLAIGADGKTLRKIAQCYTLRFLIAQANREIRRFNSRYELVQVPNSLGIRVIDHDRADDIRDTSSLSGGETFIVSLGLALALSSLSSRNISFDNLFIDEGFGTLDPDALATIIDSLASLQSSRGKKVGVISHTDLMSERISTQIRIIKNGNSGSSHIEIFP